MTALKTKKNVQWEKAQKRINVSPLVSRISGLVPQGKVGAVGCFAVGFDVQRTRGGGGQSKRRASVKLKHQELGLVMICRRLNKLPKCKTSFARATSPNAL